MNDQESYGGTCYNSSGTNKITCPAQPSYSPYPSSSTSASSCPQSLINLLGSGCHWMYPDPAGKGIYCDGPMTKSAKEGDSATTAGCVSGTTSSYTPYPTTSYTPSATYSTAPTYSASPYPTTTYTPYPTTSYTPYPTSTYTPPSDANYTPYPTAVYTPPPSCPSDQYWNGSSCVRFSPPPTSGLYNPYMVAHCQQLGRTWNGKICQANGLLARLYENSGLANMFRMFYLVP